MTPSWRCRWWKLGVASFLGMGGALAPSGDCVRAQITPDGTLGIESSVVTPTNVNGLPTNQIDGGATRGANLFHSFEQFSVPTGSAAHFNNAANIQNIFSQVTGSSISNIDGLIRANGTANLFLLNPNGIIFGPNATLNIGGSFLGSTASSLNFADGTQFSASVPQTTPLLTVNVPLGLQLGGTAGGIQVQGSGLQVQTGQTLALVGGDVSVEGGEFGFLRALGGRIELGGLTGAGIVEIEGQPFDGAFGLASLHFSDTVERADVRLTNFAYVNVAAGGGGSIAINARNLDVLGGSILLAGIGERLGSVGSQAGDITLNATDAITVGQSSTIQNAIGPDATGTNGDINIRAKSVSVTNSARLSASTFGQGDAGSVTIEARETVSFNGGNAFSSVDATGVGNGGGINITTGSLTLTNGAQLVASTRGQGDAGSVTIEARETVSFNGGNAFSSVDATGVGNGGGINITTGSLTLTNGAQLVASTRGQGDAGSVTIDARDTISVDGESAAFSSVEATGVGNGGGINITTGSLALTNGAELLSYTDGQGDAGSVNINARGTISVDGVSNGFNSGTFSSVDTGAMGNGGGINITTGSLVLTNSAVLTTSSEGSGTAGNIEVAAGSIRLENFALLSSETIAGQGNIILNSQDLVLRGGSNITTNATGIATGGNITLKTDILAALENSDISANARQGSGGRVIINAQGIFGTAFRNQLTPLSDITATSDLGPQFSGTVEINTPDVDPSRGLVNLPAELVNAAGLIVQGCPGGVGPAASKFIVTGRGGLPPTPRETIASEQPLEDWGMSIQGEENAKRAAIPIKPTNSEPAPLVEAQGWVINDKGEVVLTAHAPNVTPNLPWMTPANCYTP